MDFASFLHSIGTAARLDVGAAAQAGGCAIVFSETMEVSFEHDDTACKVLVFAPVLAAGSWSTEHRARMLGTVLQLHLFGLATDGNFFGLDPERDHIVFFRSIALDGLEPEQAVQAVESFVNQLERWQGYLVRASVLQQAPAASPAQPPDPVSLQRV